MVRKKKIHRIYCGQGKKKKKGEDFPNTGNDVGKIIKAGMLTGWDVSTDS